MMALCNNLLADSPRTKRTFVPSQRTFARALDAGAGFFGIGQESFLAISRSGGRRLQERERERGGGAAAECEELLCEEHVRPSEARGAVAALNLVPTLLLSIDWLAAAAGATTLCCFIAPRTLA